MKKSILFVAVLFSVVILNAENNQFLHEGKNFGFIPKELVKSGSPRMNVVSDNHEVLLYDNQFRLSKTIPLDMIELTYISNLYQKNGSELTLVEGDTTKSAVYEPHYYTYIDADNGTFSYYCGAPITQVLFNTDEAYEYIHYIVDPNLEEVVEGPRNPIPSDNRWNDVNDYAYKSFTNNVIGFEIKSDNGNVVQSVRFDYNFRIYREYLQDIYLLKLDNIYYLCFKGSTDNSYTASRMLIYYVGAAGSGAPLHEVAAPIATAVRKYIAAGQVYIKKDNNLYNMSGSMAK